MELEDQVVSLDLARKMKELGAEQDSAWYWIQQGDYIDDWSEAFLSSKKERAIYDLTLEGDCSAFTVAELGEMLKPHATTLPVWNQYNMGCEWFSSIWTVTGHCQINENTEANARAKMWLYLKREERK